MMDVGAMGNMGSMGDMGNEIDGSGLIGQGAGKDYGRGVIARATMFRWLLCLHVFDWLKNAASAVAG
jgi:hypothetical protein